MFSLPAPGCDPNFRSFGARTKDEAGNLLIYTRRTAARQIFERLPKADRLSCDLTCVFVPDARKFILILFF